MYRGAQWTDLQGDTARSPLGVIIWTLLTNTLQQQPKGEAQRWQISAHTWHLTAIRNASTLATVRPTDSIFIAQRVSALRALSELSERILRKLLHATSIHAALAECCPSLLGLADRLQLSYAVLAASSWLSRTVT